MSEHVTAEELREYLHPECERALSPGDKNPEWVCMVLSPEDGSDEVYCWAPEGPTAKCPVGNLASALEAAEARAVPEGMYSMTWAYRRGRCDVDELTEEAGGGWDWQAENEYGELLWQGHEDDMAEAIAAAEEANDER